MNESAWKLLELKAEILQAVAHPIRLAIVEFLGEGERCVCDIAEHLGAQRSNVSRHLAVMHKAGVLECRKEGLWMYYKLQTPCIAGCLSCVTEALRERMVSHRDLLKRM